MTHPNNEEWMSFLYGELNPEKRAQFDDHLRDCPRCQSAVRSWRTTMADLDSFEVSQRPGRRTEIISSFVKWGLAAVFVFGLGLGLGRLFSPGGHNIDKLPDTLVSGIREQLREEFKSDLLAALAPTDGGITNEFRHAIRTVFADWAASQNDRAKAQTRQLIAALDESILSGRAEDRQATLALLKNLEQQNLVAYALLKKNLDTVAVVANNRFQQAENQLGQLISYAQPNAE